MAAPTIADYMKYADLQMAAEALYDFNAKEDAAIIVVEEPMSIIDTKPQNRRAPLCCGGAAWIWH